MLPEPLLALRAGLPSPGPETEPATQPTRGWPDLIVDLPCLDLFEQATGRSCAEHAALPMDVSTLLESGAPSVLTNAAAVVIGGRDGKDSETCDMIRRLRAAAPHIGIYFVAPSWSALAAVLPRFAAAGLDDVLNVEEGRPRTERSHTLAQRLTAPAPETELRRLWSVFRESSERSFVMHCVRNAFWHDDWGLRTSLFGTSRKTLQNRMSALGLPSPGLIVRCGRMLHAQELERRGLKPGRAVAEALGFPSLASMQRARRRLRRGLLARGGQSAVFASLLR